MKYHVYASLTLPLQENHYPLSEVAIWSNCGTSYPTIDIIYPERYRF